MPAETLGLALDLNERIELAACLLPPVAHTASRAESLYPLAQT